MTNEQRREALEKARRKALEYAEAAEQGNPDIELYSDLDKAIMWAYVAGALKVGSGHDTDGVLWSHERG